MICQIKRSSDALPRGGVYEGSREKQKFAVTYFFIVQSRIDLEEGNGKFPFQPSITQ